MTRGMNYSACLYIRSHFPVSFVALFAARFSGPEVEDEWTPGLARCVCVCVCLRVCVKECVWVPHWVYEREKETHQTELRNTRATCFKGPWQSWHQIREFLWFTQTHTHTCTHSCTHTCTHAGSVTQAQYPVLRKPFVGVVGLVAAAAVAVCAVVVGRDLYPGKNWATSTKCLWLITVFCHHILSTLLHSTKIKTLCFQNSQIWRTVSGSKLASFLVCLCAL